MGKHKRVKSRTKGFIPLPFLIVFTLIPILFGLVFFSIERLGQNRITDYEICNQSNNWYCYNSGIKSCTCKIKISALFEQSEHPTYYNSFLSFLFSNRIWVSTLSYLARYFWVVAVLIAWFFLTLRKHVDDYNEHIRQLKVSHKRVKMRYHPNIINSKLWVLVIQMFFTVLIMLLAINFESALALLFAMIANFLFIDLSLHYAKRELTINNRNYRLMRLVKKIMPYFDKRVSSLNKKVICFVKGVLTLNNQYDWPIRLVKKMLSLKNEPEDEKGDVLVVVRDNVREQYLIQKDDVRDGKSSPYDLDYFDVMCGCTHAVMTERSQPRPIAIDDFFRGIHFSIKDFVSYPHVSRDYQIDFINALHDKVREFLHKLLNDFKGSRYDNFAITIGELEAHYREKLIFYWDEMHENSDILNIDEIFNIHFLVYTTILLLSNEEVPLRKSFDHLHMKKSQKTAPVVKLRSVVRQHINKVTAEYAVNQYAHVYRKSIATIITRNSLYELRDVVWQFIHIEAHARTYFVDHIREGVYNNIMQFANAKQRQPLTLEGLAQSRRSRR